MKLSEFDYQLPAELIAQEPVEPRDHSRLLVLDRLTGNTTERKFYDLPEYLEPGDALVLNDTRVLPARLYGVRSGTGGQVELVLLHRVEGNIWEVLVKPGRKVRIGAEIVFGQGELTAKVLSVTAYGGRRVELRCPGGLESTLERLGETPLPPYIHKKLADPERYQTVYAAQTGSAAAPTAGLHFTRELLRTIADRQVQMIPITLHVGLGTFRPVSVEDIADHTMHAEFYTVSEAAANAINKTRAAGKKVVAVGTTCVRTLETIADANGVARAASGWTEIFIYPGYRFRLVDGIVTNFHLPKSTLLMLVSAFAGREKVLSAYQQAIDHQYRFFSFGDAMLIAPVRPGQPDHLAGNIGGRDEDGCKL